VCRRVNGRGGRWQGVAGGKAGYGWMLLYCDTCADMATQVVDGLFFHVICPPYPPAYPTSQPARPPAHPPAHTAVGDPAKDCSGPSLHVLIKMVSTISLVLAPCFLD